MNHFKICILLLTAIVSSRSTRKERDLFLQKMKKDAELDVRIELLKESGPLNRPRETHDARLRRLTADEFRARLDRLAIEGCTFLGALTEQDKRAAEDIRQGILL